MGGVMPYLFFPWDIKIIINSFMKNNLSCDFGKVIIASQISSIQNLVRKGAAVMHHLFKYGIVLALTIMTQMSCLGITLDLKRAMENATYREQIAPLAKNLKECQIGGTHTYGNITTIKEEGPNKGKLNPAILIINPDIGAHDVNNTNVLSIVGSGFDRNLLKQLDSLCEKLQFQFDRVYINNVTSVLPVAEDAPDEISSVQRQQFSKEAGITQPDLTLGSGIDRAVMRYTARSIDERLKGVQGVYCPTLYDLYYALLKPGGRFVFKSAQSYDPVIVFASSFLTSSTFISPDSKEHCSIRFDAVRFAKDREHPQKYIEFREVSDQNLFKKITDSLKKTGDRLELEASEYTATKPFSMLESRSMIYTETNLLKNSQFTEPLVSFGQFENHGYRSFFDKPYPHAYALVIQATKPVQVINKSVRP
jgi:hypothetical protein